MTRYELRTNRGAPVFSYDSLERAKEGRRDAEKRIKTPITIYEVTLHERVVA